MLLGGAASFPLGLVPIPLNQYFMLKMLLICKLALMLCFLRSHKVLEICKFHTQYHGVIPAVLVVMAPFLIVGAYWVKGTVFKISVLDSYT